MIVSCEELARGVLDGCAMLAFVLSSALIGAAFGVPTPLTPVNSTGSYPTDFYGVDVSAPVSHDHTNLLALAFDLGASDTLPHLVFVPHRGCGSSLQRGGGFCVGAPTRFQGGYTHTRTLVHVRLVKVAKPLVASLL